MFSKDDLYSWSRNSWDETGVGCEYEIDNEQVNLLQNEMTVLELQLAQLVKDRDSCDWNETKEEEVERLTRDIVEISDLLHQLTKFEEDQLWDEAQKLRKTYISELENLLMYSSYMEVSIDNIKSLINSTTYPNLPYQNPKEDALTIAIQNKHLELITFLIEDSTRISSEQITAACRSGNLDIFNLVTRHGNFQAQTESSLGIHQNTLLASAAQGGNLDIVKLIMQNNPNISRICGNAIREAVENKHFEVVRFLVENSLDSYEKDPYTLDIAVRAQSWNIVEFLFAHNYKLKSVSDIMLKVALENRLDIIQMLIKNGVDINSGEYTVLAVASERSNLALAKFALENGADLYINDNLAIRLASQAKKWDMVKFLVKHYDKEHIANCPAFIFAICQGNIEMIKFLVEHGVNQNLFNGAALVLAAEIDNLELAQHLIKHGADIRLSSADMLKTAVKNARPSLVEFLIKKGANVTSIQDLLSYVKPDTDPNVIKLLLSCGMQRTLTSLKDPTIEQILQSNNIKAIDACFKYNFPADLTTESFLNSFKNKLQALKNKFPEDTSFVIKRMLSMKDSALFSKVAFFSDEALESFWNFVKKHGAMSAITALEHPEIVEIQTLVIKNNAISFLDGTILPKDIVDHICEALWDYQNPHVAALIESLGETSDLTTP